MEWLIYPARSNIELNSLNIYRSGKHSDQQIYINGKNTFCIKQTGCVFRTAFGTNGKAIWIAVLSVSGKTHRSILLCVSLITRQKGEAVLLKAWSAPEGSRKLRFPDILTISLDGGKVVSLTYGPHLPQQIPLVLNSVRGSEGFMSTKN
jgi:hypothetical protein